MSTKRAWKLQDFVAHGSNVNCVALGHKSGRVMATGGEDKKVNMWTVGKPNCIMSLTGHMSPVESLRFGNSEEMVVAGAMSGALKIWNLEAAKIVRTLNGHKSNVRSLDFHPYGDFVASGSLDTNIKLWDIRRKGCIFTYKGHSGCVNSIRFSPDGRWFASASEDSFVKIWDLTAGKLLTDLKRHTAAVNTIEYHPNEYLLASGSSDKTVKFWDLEKFEMISSSDGDSSPIRSVFFHPEGSCLYAGSQNLLRVYGWEPGVTHDSVHMDWAKVADIAIAHNQLIGVSYLHTNVSTYVVDIQRVQPLGSDPSSARATAFTPQPPPPRHRRSFVNERPPTQSTKQAAPKVAPEPDPDPSPNDDDDAQSVVDIKDPEDYSQVFQPRNKLAHSPPRNSEPFPAPPADATSKAPSAALTSKPPPAGGHPISEAPSSCGPPRRERPGSNKSSTPSESRQAEAPAQKQEPRTDAVLSGAQRHQQTTQPQTKQEQPTRRPSPKSPPRRTRATAPPPDNDEPTKQQRQQPQANSRLAGLNADDFLPKPLVPSVDSSSTPVSLTESEALKFIRNGNNSMMAVLSGRQRNLQLVRTLWTGGNMKTAFDSAIGMNDQAVIVDLLNILTQKPASWTLDLCSLVLPQIEILLLSKYDNYKTAAYSALRVILKNFAPVIKATITAPPSTGVDIMREERFSKCKSCYASLTDIRVKMEQKGSGAGKLAGTVRELQLLMSQLD